MLTRFSASGLAILFMAFTFGCATQQETDRHRARERVVDTTLIGIWTVKNADLGGRPFSLPLSFELKINGTDYGTRDFNRGTRYTDVGTLFFFGDELAGEPRRIDVLGKEGPNKGKRIPAIYRVSDSGREFEICYDLDAKERPTDFVSREGTMWLRVSYVRKPT